MKVVDDFSSKLDLPERLETVESIDANHMQMARCRSRTDPQYRAISKVLTQFMRGLQHGAEAKVQSPPLETDRAAVLSSTRAQQSS